MCFNKETSIIAFIIGILCAGILINRGNNEENNVDILSGILLIVIASMQIVEYFLWKYDSCGQKNRIASYFLLLVLYSQPIIYYFYKSKILGDKYKKFNIIFLCITIILFFTFFMKYIYSSKKLCSLKNIKTGRLEWAPLKIMYDKRIWWFLVFGAYLYLFNIKVNDTQDKVNFIRKYFIIISLIISLIYSYVLTGKDFFANMGSLWCFMCVFYGIVCIFFPVKK